MSEEKKQCEAIADLTGEQCKNTAKPGEDFCTAHLGGVGRPQREFTDQERKFVEVMTMAGVNQEDISEVLGCSPNTLRKHCNQELTEARARANAKVVATAFQMATSGKDTSMTIFWLKTQMGWSTKNRLEHSGPDGGPIETKSQSIDDLLGRLLPGYQPDVKQIDTDSTGENDE